MKKNMGKCDRILRAVGAVIIAILYLTGVLTGTLGMVLLVVALVLLLTSLMGFCPAYTIFGMKTCSKCSIDKSDE